MIGDVLEKDFTTLKKLNNWRKQQKNDIMVINVQYRVSGDYILFYGIIEQNK